MVQGTGRCCIGFLPALIAVVAIGSGLLSTFWCELIKFSPDTSNLPDLSILNEENLGSIKFGLYYFSNITGIEVDSAEDTLLKVTDSCVDYGSGVNFDAAWKSARAFALVAPICAAILVLALLCAPTCIFFSRRFWMYIAFCFLLIIPAFQSLTLLILASDACKDNPVLEYQLEQSLQVIRGEMAVSQAPTSSPITGAVETNNNNMTVLNDNVMLDVVDEDGDTTGGITAEDHLKLIYSNDCEWDWGMWANIISMILYFVCGVIMVLMGPPTRPPPPPTEMQTVTYEEKNGEDGQITVEEVKVETETLKPNQSPAWANPSHPSSSVHGSNASGLEQAKPY